MEENDLDEYDKKDFYLIMTFSSIFVLLYLIYFSLVICYIIKNYQTKKLCIFWLDYCCLIFTGILFIIVYLINILFHDERINNPKDLSHNFFSLAIILSLTTMCVTIISSLFFDAITAFKLSFKMKKIKKINVMEFYELSQRFKDIKINNILKMKYNYKYYIIFSIISITYIILCFLAYRDTNIKNFDGLLNLSSYFTYLLRYYHLITLFLLIVGVFFMDINKKSLLKKNYYNSNRIAQKAYDVHISQIVYFTDVISFKLISDLFMNIPAIFFLSFGKFNCFTLIASEISIFLFIILGGSEYLIMDRDNCIENINKKIIFFFCFKKLNFHFGEKDQRANLEIFRLNYSNYDDENILDSISISAIKNIENIFLEFSETETEGSVLGLNQTDSFKSMNSVINSNIININQKRYIDFETVPEFYLVQKLLMIFFIINKKVYETMDSHDDSFSEIKKCASERISKRMTINVNWKKDIYNMERIGKISITDTQKIYTNIKSSQNDIFNSIEEKELLQELKKKFNITNEKYTFKAESILTTELSKIFPYFQMKINTIIKSLNPARNIKIFNKFINRNNNHNNTQNGFEIINEDNRLSIKSTKSKTNIDNSNYITNSTINKKELDKNLYYTHDLYLMYEIYDEKDFPKLEELRKIINEYNSYLSSAFQNMNYSFLPLILGIFKMQLFDSNKIVVLYRNPLYFTNYFRYSHWINFYITEEPEKIKVSSLFNDVIDVNEIEIKNTLELNDSDYAEVKRILKNDYNFLIKVKNIYPIIHLFIGDEKSSGGDITNLRARRHKNQFNENSILGDLYDNNDIGIFDILENNLSTSNINIMEEPHETVNEKSLFDKEYYFLNENDIRTIKIYFTNLFRKDCDLNKTYENKYNQVNTESYCQYLQDQILNYIKKSNLFNDDDKNDEDFKL